MKTTLVALALGLCSLTALAANPHVALKTSQGTVEVELYPEQAPKTVANFTQYVKDGFYDGTLFHRVIDGFMVQGGGFDRTFKEKPTRASIPNEANNGLKNEPGTLAMARTSDPNSASAQFFINVADNAFLNYRAPTTQGYGYAVFGRVVKGMHVVNRIAKSRTTRQGMYQDVPATPVLIEKATLLP